MSDKLVIKTNRVPRQIFNGDELTAKELKDFDYLSEDKLMEHSFVRYKGIVYDLGDFMRIESVTPQMKESGFRNWDGYSGDSYFSGVVCRYTHNFEYVIMGTYIS